MSGLESSKVIKPIVTIKTLIKSFFCLQPLKQKKNTIKPFVSVFVITAIEIALLATTEVISPFIDKFAIETVIASTSSKPSKRSYINSTTSIIFTNISRNKKADQLKVRKIEER